ncbi:hypothetical protein [Xanthomonas sp. WHRI 7945]|nr:hypothetical protein [Xanthomonas campestris pv. campestris]
MPCIAIAQPASAAHLPHAPSLRRRVRGLAIFLMMLDQHPGAGAMVVGARKPAVHHPHRMDRCVAGAAADDRRKGSVVAASHRRAQRRLYRR